MKFLFVTLLLALCFNASALEERYVIEPHTFKITHGSSLVALPNNQLLSCFFAGKKEAQPDIEIYCAKFTDGKWQKHYKVVKRQDRSMWSSWNFTLGNSVLHYDRHDRLWMFYAGTPFGGWAAGQVHYKVSLDEGKTWTRGRRLTRWIGKLARNKIMELEDGSFLLPLYHEMKAKQGTIYHLFPNDPPRNFIGKWSWRRIPGNNHIQPSLLKDPDNDKIHIYMRNMKKGKAIYSSMQLSNLPKLEYTAPVKLEVNNPNSSLDTIRFKDKALMVYNNDPEERMRITLAYSDDFINFTPIYNFENDSDKEIKHAYPTIIQDADGNYHIAYSYLNGSSIKHVKMTEAEIEHLINEAKKKK